MTEPERLASALMANLHNNRLMTTVDLERAAHTIKEAFEKAIEAEREECASLASAIGAYDRGHPLQNVLHERIAAAIRSRGEKT